MNSRHPTLASLLGASRYRCNSVAMDDDVSDLDLDLGDLDTDADADNLGQDLDLDDLDLDDQVPDLRL